MEVIWVLVALGIIFSIYFIYKKIKTLCEKKYAYNAFGGSITFLMALGWIGIIASMFFISNYYDAPLQHSGDQLNALLSLAAGLIMWVVAFIKLAKHTSIPMALAAFGINVFSALVMMVGYIGISMFVASAMNKDKKRQ